MPRDSRTDRLADDATSPLTAEELSRALDELEAENREVRREREKIFRALIDEHRKREQEQHFLSDVSVILAASLDYDAVLSSIVRVCIPYLADCAVVDIVQPDQIIHRTAVSHRKPQFEGIVWSLDEFIEANVAYGPGKVIQTGRPELYSVVSPDLETAIARNERHLRTLRLLGFKSHLCVPLKTRGETIGALGLMREAGSEPYTSSDVSLAENLADRAALALENAGLYKREQEANRLKDEFLATVSHELRTPLTPILGAVYMLRLRHGDWPELAAPLDMIDRNAKRQARIVEDLIDISRIAKGSFELNKRPANILSITQAAVDGVRPAAEALGIRFDVDFQSSSRSLCCDPERIQQAISNVLSNAMKFTPPGGQISVRLSHSPNSARITVADTGAGIPAEFLPHVFERFRQADRFTTRGHGGLGVGLSIVRYIVEKHNGSVHAESHGEGHGAVFTIELPY